jgi:aminomethyltransferase
MSNKTPLFDEHRNQHAKIVDFAGWDMPLHYGSQLSEHEQVRQDAGMFDVSHMMATDVSGAKACQFLQHLLANDVARLKEKGKALYTCMLNPAGGVLDDLIVYRLNDTDFRIVSNAGTRDKDFAWWQQHAKDFAVKLTQRTDYAMLALQGPKAIDKTIAALGGANFATVKTLKAFTSIEIENLFIARTGYTGEDGVEILIPQDQVVTYWQKFLRQGIKPCGLGARDTLRLEAGLNLYGTDMDETTTPLESNLAWTIAWDPTDRQFIGREVLEKQRQQGNHKRLVGLVLQERGVLRHGQKVIVANRGEGEITSGSFSPLLNAGIALARIPAGEENHCQVEIRGKLLAAKIVKPPFVKHGKILV